MPDASSPDFRPADRAADRGLFAAINWSAFSTPTTLSLVVHDGQAPVGVIMLVLLAVACIAFIAWAIPMQGRALMDSRRMTKDLQAQRELADKAEASRFTELRAHLDTGSRSCSARSSSRATAWPRRSPSSKTGMQNVDAAARRSIERWRRAIRRAHDSR